MHESLASAAIDSAMNFTEESPSGVMRAGERLPDSSQGVAGLSESLVEVYRVIDRVADATCNVLITGESGTGKELVARAVHRASPRANKAFVAVNCGAIPEALLESELFGYARGASTSARASRVGRIAMAEGGTLFLDEIGDMPMSLQVKLLGVLQAREYSPVADNPKLKADVRIVAASSVNLENAVQAGSFHEELYYCLNVIHLTVPALRERMSPHLPDAGLDLRNAVESFENELIRQALERTQGNKKQAASLLGLNRTTLVEMLKRKRINPRAA